MPRGKRVLILSAAFLATALLRPVAVRAGGESECEAQCEAAKEACIAQAQDESAGCKQSCKSFSGTARGECNQGCSQIFRAQKDSCLADFETCEQVCEGATTTSTVAVTTTTEATTTTSSTLPTSPSPAFMD